MFHHHRRAGFGSCLRQVETHTAFACSQLQLCFHNFAGRILGYLQIVDACHHWWKILVWILVAINLLSNDSKWWRQSLETSCWQSWSSRDELKKESLLFAIVLTQNVVEMMNGYRVLRESVIGTTAISQHSNIPFLIVSCSWATEDVFQFLRVEDAKMIYWEHRVESWNQKQIKIAVRLVNFLLVLPSRNASNWRLTPSTKNQCVTSDMYWWRLWIVTGISRPPRRSSRLG